MTRFHVSVSLVLALAVAPAAACFRQVTPASRTCQVLTNEAQLDACVGKVVTVRGKVTHASPAKIAGVEVEAGAELYDRVAHARGTLEKQGTGYALKQDGGLAKAHSATPAKTAN